MMKVDTWEVPRMKRAERLEEMIGVFNGRDSISFANCLLLDSWYKGILMGMNEEALAEAENALEITRSF